MAQEWTFRLTDDQKLMCVAAGFGFVAFVLAATVCIVQPTCYVYKKIWGKREKERAARIAAAKQLGLPLPLAVMSPPELRKSQHSLASLDQNELTPRAITPVGPAAQTTTSFVSFPRGGVRDSTYSSMSSGSRGDATVPAGEPTAEGAGLGGAGDDVLNQGHATITVRFLPQPQEDDGNRLIGQLGVNVKDAQDLPVRAYGVLCDPYVVVQVVRDVKRMRKRKKGPSKVCEFVTQTKRRTQCPLFNEGFVVPVTKSDIRDGGVLVKVFDAEKYANHTLLGEALVSLKSYELEHETVEHIVTVDLSAPSTDNGEMHVGLNYLPTSERLTIRVLRCSNIPLQNLPPADPGFNQFFIRVLFYHNGKLIKRKKTTARPGLARSPSTSSASTTASGSSHCSPVLDDSFMFDVPLADIDNVVFVVILCLAATVSVSSPETPVAPAVTPEKTNEYLGKVVLGSTARGASFRHWEAMKDSPRREVVYCHNLI